MWEGGIQMAKPKAGVKGKQDKKVDTKAQKKVNGAKAKAPRKSPK
jgi:hypothetical protein